MLDKEVPKFQIKLDPKYEEQIFNRFTELAEKAIEQAVDRASFHRQFLTQAEVMKLMQIGHGTMTDLYKKGLKFIKIGNKKMIDIDDLKETLNKLKF